MRLVVKAVYTGSQILRWSSFTYTFRKEGRVPRFAETMPEKLYVCVSWRRTRTQVRSFSSPRNCYIALRTDEVHLEVWFMDVGFLDASNTGDGDFDSLSTGEVPFEVSLE